MDKPTPLSAQDDQALGQSTDQSVEPVNDFQTVYNDLQVYVKQPVAEWDHDYLETALSKLQLLIAQEEERMQDEDETPAATEGQSITHYKGLLKALQQSVREQWQALEQEKAAEEQANLDKKWAIVQDIKTLTETSERISPALKRIKELQSAWRTTGNVPTHAFQQLRNAYNYEVDRFFYTISIYRDLRDLDLQKNGQAKQELVEKMKALQEEPSIRRTEIMVKALQEEWEEVGPVPHNDWEALRDAFYTATDAVYARIQLHYDGIRKQLDHNLQAKQQLLGRAKQLSGLDLKSPAKWNDKTNEILHLQQEWKAIGRVPREHNEAIWEQFREACDTFFSRKRQFFAQAKAQHENAKQQKEAILQQAINWKDSEDWKSATDALIKLQADWKAAPAADRATEQRLWDAFRSACDAFFERKKEHFAAQSAEQKENAKLKKALVKTIEESSLPQVHNKALEQLKAWAKEWHSIGHVPRRDMQAINQAFKKVMDDQYASLKKEKTTKGTAQYQAKVELMAEMPNNKQALNKELNFLKNKIRRLEGERQQFEDNLSRFRITTKDSPLVKEVKAQQAKIDAEIERLQKQLSIVEKAF